MMSAALTWASLFSQGSSGVAGSSAATRKSWPAGIVTVGMTLQRNW
jgi:hypothetical protein